MTNQIGLSSKDASVKTVFHLLHTVEDGILSRTPLKPLANGSRSPV